VVRANRLEAKGEKEKRKNALRALGPHSRKNENGGVRKGCVEENGPEDSTGKTLACQGRRVKRSEGI